MKRNYRSLFVSLFLGAIITLSCTIPFIATNNSTDNGSPEIIQTITPIATEQSGKPIPSDQDTTLGGTLDDPALIHIPAGAFEMDIAAQMSYPDALPADPGQGWTGLGTPLQVDLESEQTRSDQPMQVTIDFEPQGIQETGISLNLMRLTWAKAHSHLQPTISVCWRVFRPMKLNASTNSWKNQPPKPLLNRLPKENLKKKLKPW